MAAVLAAAPAGARAAGYPECLQSADQAHHKLVRLGKSTAQPATIPGPNGTTYAGDLYAPKPQPMVDSGAPVAIVMHGIDGSPCGVRWIARYLAGKGFFAVDVYRPPTTDPVAHDDERAEVLKHADAIQAAVDYVRSSAYPYTGYVDPSDIALVGHSLGASASGILQSQVDGITALVALDGLRHYAAHDPGLPFNCDDRPDLELTPKVPALGLMSEADCPQHRPHHVAQLRKTGYKRWRAAGIDTVVVALRGFAHGSFTGSGKPGQLRKVARLMLRWLDHYTRGASGRPFTGVPDQWLSKKYLSGAFLPDFHIDCGNLFACGP
jgi:dienelactone hydrolase